MNSYERLKIKYEELLTRYSDLDILCNALVAFCKADSISDTDKVKVISSTLEACGFVKK